MGRPKKPKQPTPPSDPFGDGGDHEPLDLSAENESVNIDIPETQEPKLAVPLSPSPPLDTKFCSECGEKIRRKAEICPKCGCRQGSEEPTASIKPVGREFENRRLMTGGLCLFLGALGTHHFYRGSYILGAIYLAITLLDNTVGNERYTRAVVAICMAESVFYFTMSSKYFAENIWLRESD